jgi:peptidoglycan/xylan/chitin deacetylase (PgdA/CDA1 family)
MQRTLIAASLLAALTLPALAELPEAATLQKPAKSSDVELHMRLVHPPAGQREVAMTFDACSGAFDQRIANVLIADHVPATIFVTHRWLKRNAAATALLLAHPDLFEIENHGDQHIPAITDEPTVYGLKTAGSLSAVQQEVQGGAAAVLAATGKRPHWYRDASAVYSRDAIAAIHGDGYAVAGFSLNGDIGASLPAAAVEKRVEAAKSGDVIIGHINQPTHSAGAGFVLGIERLVAEGTVFVRLDQAATVAVK